MRSIPFALRLSKGAALHVAAVFVVALALYTWTLAPTVTLVDSGELIVAAHGLGVAHPPGFPLYLLLAHAATWLPFGNVAMRVNFASAVFAALAAALLVAMLAEGLAPPPTSGRTNRGARESALASATVPMLVGALLLAFSRTLWSYATIAEVYTLNTALIVAVFALMLGWRRRTLQRTTSRDRFLYAAAFVFGLALGVHHVTVGLTLPALAVFVYMTAGGAFFRGQRLAYAALCALAGVSIYAYVPLAAARSPLLNWGDPRTLQRLWWHITGEQYHAYFSFSPQALGNQAADFFRRILREFGPWWFPAGLLLAAIGFGHLFRRDRSLCVFLALVAAANMAYAFTYPVDEDMDAYYLPTFVVLAVAAAYGVQRLLAWVRGDGSRRLAAIALLLVPTLALASNFRFNNRSRYFVARDYVENILRPIAPGGMLLTLDWQVCAPLLYVRTIEQYRRDVTLIDINLLRRSWYFSYLRREYPEVMAPARAEVDAFVDDLRQWEQDPDAFRRDSALAQRIDGRFRAMLLAFVSRHLGTAPVYITQDVALNRSPQDRRFSEALAAAYQFIPQGLVFQLVDDRDFHEPAQPQLVTRGLSDATSRFEPDDVVRLKVLPVYVSMLYNRGRYLQLHGRHAQADTAFRQSLALDPTFAPAQAVVGGTPKAGR